MTSKQNWPIRVVAALVVAMSAAVVLVFGQQSNIGAPGYYRGGSGSQSLLPDGTASAPSYSFADAPNTGWYSSVDNTQLLTSIGGSLIAIQTVGTFVVETLTLSLGAQDAVLSRTAADTFGTPDRFVSSGATAGIGYSTGAGGTVTQATNKGTGVTLNFVTGQITMNAASLAADTAITFTLTSSAIFLNDHILATHISAGTLGAYTVMASGGAAGSCTITIRNNTTGALAEAIVLKYSVFKSTTS